MAAEGWGTVPKVNERLAFLTTGRNFDDDDLDERLERAETTLWGYLATQFANDRIAAWDESPPAEVRELTCDLAAAYVLADFYSDQKIKNEDTDAGGLFAKVMGICKQMVKGEYEIVDSSGEEVPLVEPGVETTIGSRTQTYKMGNVGDDTLGDEVLDQW